MDLLLAFILFPFDWNAAPYVTLFFALALSSIGLPIPEEITLLLGGYLAYADVIQFWPAIYTLAIGIIAGDILGYLVGKKWGPIAWEKSLKRWHVADNLLQKAKGYFDRHGEKVVIFSRPVFGFRVVVPILAGYFRMNFVKFILYDLIAAIPWTILLVSLSYYLGASFDLIIEVRAIKHLLFALIGLAIVSYGIIHAFKNLMSRV